MQRTLFFLIALQLLASCSSGGYCRPYISDVTHEVVASEQAEPR